MEQRLGHGDGMARQHHYLASRLEIKGNSLPYAGVILGPASIVSAYDFSPIGESRVARYIPVMTKPFTLLTTAACFFAFLILAPTSPAQNPAAEEKVIALAQQLKLTPQQEVEVMPILKAEAPKFEAIRTILRCPKCRRWNNSMPSTAKTRLSCRKFLPRRSIKSYRLFAKPTSRRRSRQSAPSADRTKNSTGAQFVMSVMSSSSFVLVLKANQIEEEGRGRERGGEKCNEEAPSTGGVHRLILPGANR